MSADLWMRARVMQPKAGRFISIDPMVEDGQTDHSHSYSYDQPSRLIDPSGWRAYSCVAFGFESSTFIPTHWFLCSTACSPPGAYGYYSGAGGGVRIEPHTDASCKPRSPNRNPKVVCTELRKTSAAWEAALCACIIDSYRAPAFSRELGNCKFWNAAMIRCACEASGWVWYPCGPAMPDRDPCSPWCDPDAPRYWEYRCRRCRELKQ